MATQGIDNRQSTGRLLFRAFLQDDAGDLVATGTTELRLFELQDDATIKWYDWTANTFGTGTPTDDEATMTHRTYIDHTGPPGGVQNTGVWTAALTTLTGFTVGTVYLAEVYNAGASPTHQVREFQYGGGIGDVLVDITSKAFYGYGAAKASGLALSTQEKADVQAEIDAAILETVRSVVHGDYWIVDKAGDNSDGKTVATAFTTIVAAYTAACVVGNGGTILIGTGTFTEGYQNLDGAGSDRLRFVGSGGTIWAYVATTPGDFIIQPGEDQFFRNIEFQQTGTTDSYAVELKGGGNRVVFESCRIVGTDTAIWIEDVRGVVLRDCTIQGTSVGVYTDSANETLSASTVRLENCDIVVTNAATARLRGIWASGYSKVELYNTTVGAYLDGVGSINRPSTAIYADEYARVLVTGGYALSYIASGDYCRAVRTAKSSSAHTSTVILIGSKVQSNGTGTYCADLTVDTGALCKIVVVGTTYDSTRVSGTITYVPEAADIHAHAAAAQTSLDALETDALAELAADPGATPTIKKVFSFLYMLFRNVSTETGTTKTLKNSAGTTVLQAPMSDDGTTFTKGKFTAP